MSNQKCKIKSGDNIIVIAGSHKGHTGVVNRVKLISKKGKQPSFYVYVDGITCKKHVRPNPNKETEGGIMDVAKAIHVSNVAIKNPDSNAADRIGYTTDDSGKHRIYRKTQKSVDSQGAK